MSSTTAIIAKPMFASQQPSISCEPVFVFRPGGPCSLSAQASGLRSRQNRPERGPSGCKTLDFPVTQAVGRPLVWAEEAWSVRPKDKIET